MNPGGVHTPGEWSKCGKESRAAIRAFLLCKSHQELSVVGESIHLFIHSTSNSLRNFQVSGPTLGHIVRQKEVNRTQCLLRGCSRAGGGDLQSTHNGCTVTEEAAGGGGSLQGRGQPWFPQFPLPTALSSYTSDYKAK